MIQAAQYIRMSTDRQDLSPAIQKEAIAAYAAARDVQVVATYEDLGRSGVALANRPGLSRLLRDVTQHPPFSVILVHDVSRWGRFQDADAAAYYDYHCRLHGASVIYIAETFGDELSSVAALMKSMKRVMAGEYSRDLAFKCVAGQQRVLAMGCQMGHPPPLGYRRESVSADGLRRVRLEPGQRKLALTDRIHWVLADDDEVALVRLIFDAYAHSDVTILELVRRGRTEGWVSARGRPLTTAMFATELRSEAVIGNFVWGRPQHCGKHRIASGGLTRHAGVVPRIVDDSTWALAQAKLVGIGWQQRSSEAMLRDLQLAVQRNPGLTTSQLPSQGCASKGTYRTRFGNWTAALAAADMEPTLLTRNAHARALENRTVGYRYGRALEQALLRRGVPALFDGKFHILRVRRSDIRIRLLWPVVRAGGRVLWQIASYPYSRDVDQVLFVRVDGAGSPMDFFLVDSLRLGAGFPRWLARDVPSGLHSHWCQSRKDLLKRLGGPRGEAAGNAEGRGRFSAVALARHRHKLGLSARECGALTGVTLQTILHWEKGISWPSRRHRDVIAQFQRLGANEAALRLAALLR